MTHLRCDHRRMCARKLCRTSGSSGRSLPHEVYGDSERGHEYPQQPEFKQRVPQRLARLRAPLELRSDDEDPPDDGDDADVEERLDGDLVRTHDEAKRVEQL